MIPQSTDQSPTPIYARQSDVSEAKRVAEASRRRLQLFNVRPDPPRGVKFKDDAVSWEEPKETANVTHYRIYLDTEDNLSFQVPQGQRRLQVTSASRIFISSFNQESGLESIKLLLNEQVSPPSGTVSGNFTDVDIQKEIDALPPTGGCIELAAGTWKISRAILVRTGKNNVHISGCGRATLLVRVGDIAAGFGMFDVYGKGFRLENLVIDGQVTKPAEIPYSGSTPSVLGSPINADPMADLLTKNTSIWIHGGADNSTINDLVITHTGGYSVLLDARAKDLFDSEIFNCQFINNRPHLFGNPGDTNYGSWTGGILYHNDGRSPSKTAVRGLKVTGCRWKRCTGNCLWGHSYGFDVMNEGLRLSDNEFEEIALDGIQVGATTSGQVEGNRFYRVGYVTKTDADAAKPAYLPGRFAVAIDTAGYATGVDYVGNVIHSVNGEGIDCDGLSDSNISGNAIVIPTSDDPNYAADQVALYGIGAGNITKGIQTGNTFFPQGARRLSITNNTIINMGANAISLYDARDCLVSGNTIWHRVNPSVIGIFGIPIVLFSGGTDADHETYRNTITGNLIDFDIPNDQLNPFVRSANHCIAESDELSQTIAPGAIVPGPNYVFNNRCLGNNDGEWFRSPSSTSAARVDFPTNMAGDESLSFRSLNYIQREGAGISANLKVYKEYVDGGGVVRNHAILQLADGPFQFPLSFTPILSVFDTNDAGVVQPRTGAITTADRTVAGAMTDYVFSGKVLADAFFMLKDYGADVGLNDTDANQFDSNYAMLRYNKAGSTIEASMARDGGGNRVWFPISSAGGGSVNKIIGTAYQIEVDPAGGQGDVTLSFPATIVVAGISDLSPAITSTLGYVDSHAGFLSNFPSYNTFQAPNGGMFAQAFVTPRYINIAGIADFPSAVTNDDLHADAAQDNFATNAVLWHNTTAQRLVISAQGVMIDPGNVSSLEVARLIVKKGYVNAENGFFSSVQSFGAVSLISDDGLTRTGGLNSRSATLNYVNFVGTAGIVPTAGDSFTGGGSPYQKAGQLYYETGEPAFVMLAKRLHLSPGNNATASALLIDSGYADVAHGFHSAHVNYNTFQAPNGGMSARAFVPTDYINFGGKSAISPVTADDFTGTGVSKGQIWFNTNLPGFTLNAKRINLTPGFPSQVALLIDAGWVQTVDGFIGTGDFFNVFQATGPNAGFVGKRLTMPNIAVDPGPAAGNVILYSKNGLLWISENGAPGRQAFVASSSVTSVTGTPNQVTASPTTGNVVLSLPQNIDPAANVTFNALQCNSPATNAVAAPNGTVFGRFLGCNGVAQNAIQATAGGVASNLGFYLLPSFTNVIDSAGNGRFLSLVINGSLTVNSSRDALLNSISINGTTAINSLRQANFSAVNIGAQNVIDGFGNASFTAIVTSGIGGNGAGTISCLSYYIFNQRVINSAGQFTGPGVNCGASGIAGGGFNPFIGGIQYFGEADTVVTLKGPTSDGSLTVKGGVIVSHVNPT